MNAITTLPENNSVPYEMFWKPLLEDPTVRNLEMTLHTGKIGKELYFDSEFTANATLKESCGWDYKEGTPITKKQLDPGEWDYSFKQCYIPFLKSIFGDNLPDGWRKGELTPELVTRIVDKQTNAFNKQMLYILFLSNSGSSYNFLTRIEGVYAKLLAGVAANDGTVDAGAITDTDLQPANIEATMYRIYIAQSDLMKGYPDADKRFWVTRTVYEAWRRYLQTQTGLNNTVQTSYITDGVNNISYQGIPLVDLSFVDRGLRLFETSASLSPPAVENPNRVILTLPWNHHIMIDGDGFEMIDPFYDRVSDEVLSPASAMIDYQYGEGEFNVIAGF